MSEQPITVTRMVKYHVLSEDELNAVTRIGLGEFLFLNLAGVCLGVFTRDVFFSGRISWWLPILMLCSTLFWIRRRTIRLRRCREILSGSEEE
jgi:hypothetical protein